MARQPAGGHHFPDDHDPTAIEAAALQLFDLTNLFFDVIENGGKQLLEHRKSFEAVTSGTKRASDVVRITAKYDGVYVKDVFVDVPESELVVWLDVEEERLDENLTLDS